MTGYDEKGELYAIRFGAITATDPLHAEAHAMLQALQLVSDRFSEKQGVQIIILSDCQTLIDAVLRNSVEDLLIWRVAMTVAECGNLFMQHRDDAMIQKATRKAI